MEQAGQLGHAPLDGGPVPAVYFQGERQMFADRHGDEEGAVLGDITDAAVLGGSQVGDIAAGQENAAAGNALQAANRFEDGGLAAAGLAHQDAVFAGRHLEGNAFQRESALADAEGRERKS